MQAFLKNQRVLLTGFHDTNVKAAKYVEQLGGEALHCPLQEMTILPGSIRLLGKSDWIIFTSPASARLYMQHIYPLSGFDKAVCVGPGTRAALEDDYGRACNFIPDANYSSLGLAKAMCKEKELFLNKKILFPCSQLASHALEQTLAEVGISIQRHDFYKPESKQLASIPDFDALCFFSPSAVQSLGELKGAGFLKGKKVALIGSSTAEAFEEIFGSDYTKASEATAEQTVLALYQ